MASLFSSAIVAFCTSTASGQYVDACKSATDAGTRQAGWRQSADNTEDKTVNYFNGKLVEIAPKPLQDSAAATIFIYRAAKQRKLAFKLPNLGLCSEIRNEIEPDRYGVTLRWDW